MYNKIHAEAYEYKRSVGFMHGGVYLLVSRRTKVSGKVR